MIINRKRSEKFIKMMKEADLRERNENLKKKECIFKLNGQIKDNIRHH